tara:strand:- start:632 stop:865 length:234 start_codon:yes stop_codon:yes gene_type:complete
MLDKYNDSDIDELRKDVEIMSKQINIIIKESTKEFNKIIEAYNQIINATNKESKDAYEKAFGDAQDKSWSKWWGFKE